MERVKVKAVANHYGNKGMILAGAEYETDKNHAAELKRNGLVEYDGPAAEKVEGAKILVRDKPREQKPEAEKVETEPAKEKKEITKPTTKK